MADAFSRYSAARSMPVFEPCAAAPRHRSASHRHLRAIPARRCATGFGFLLERGDLSVAQLIAAEIRHQPVHAVRDVPQMEAERWKRPVRRQTSSVRQPFGVAGKIFAHHREGMKYRHQVRWDTFDGST